MVENFRSRAEFLLTTCDGLIHLRYLGGDLGGNLPGGQAARLGVSGCLASGRQVAQAEHDQGLGSIFQSGLIGERMACGQNTSESFGGAGVGEIEMLENFGSAPFLGRMPG